MLKIESRHEAAFNACGEAMVELGLIGSLNYDSRFSTDVPFIFTAKVGDAYVAGSGASPAEALAKFAEKAVEEEANPKLQTAKETKAAAKVLIEEYRHKAEGDRTALDPVLDEIADRLDALQVKG